MPVKLKRMIYRTVVRPAMLCGAETWVTTQRHKARVEVNEMRMLRLMCRVTRKNKIRNEHIRGTTKVAQASEKITERRLKWYGHVMRMEEEHVERRVLTKEIPGKVKRGKPKTRWKDVCRRERGLTTIPATLDDGKSQKRRIMVVCLCGRCQLAARLTVSVQPPVLPPLDCRLISCGNDSDLLAIPMLDQHLRHEDIT